MRYVNRAAASLTGVALLSAGAFASAATAAAAPAAPSFGAFLLNSGGHNATLVCSPDSGSYPDQTRACRSLRLAGGDFAALPHHADQICPDYYKAYPASAAGIWIDTSGPKVVRYSHTFGNSCFAARATDGVFGF